MKIATWNIERPANTSKRLPYILEVLKKVDADILILTETNEHVNLGKEYNVFHTSKLTETYYTADERRVSIYSKYKAVGQFETFRNDTSLCILFETPFGNLAVYGTIIGTHGNRKKDFIEDLDKQLLDFAKIAATEKICIAGDLNTSFIDNYYFTEEGRQKLNDAFNKADLVNLTEEIPENIDHIIISSKFAPSQCISTDMWNVNKKLSDHLGIVATFYDMII